MTSPILIKRELDGRIAKMYINDLKRMKEELVKLDEEFESMSKEEIINKYGNIEEVTNGEHWRIQRVNHSNKAKIYITLFKNGKQLDNRHKEFKNFKKEGFRCNPITKSYELIIEL